MKNVAKSIAVALSVAFLAVSAPAIAQTAANAGGPAEQTQAQAQAELDAAIQSVRSEVTGASDAFTSDATPSLASTAAKYASDAITVSNGLTALHTYVESVAMPAVTVAKLSRELAEAAKRYKAASAIDAGSHGSEDCEQIARLHDKLNALLNVGVAANASQDEMLETLKGLFAQVNGRNDPANSLVMSDLLRKLALSNSAEADINGFLVQSAEEDAKSAFYKNCGSFAGPLTATMTAHFMTKQNQEWWTYETELTGLLRLHYFLKDAQSGGPAKITGEVLGSATHFEYKTDPFSTAYVKLVAGGHVTKVETAPVADAKDTTESYLRAQTSPVGFIANVTGTLTGNTLALQLTDSPKDFDPDYTQGTTLATVFSPLTNLLPVKTSYKLPYKNARWILDKFFGPGMTLNVSTEGDHRITHLQDSKTKPGAQNSADYTILFFACDPACL